MGCRVATGYIPRMTRCGCVVALVLGLSMVACSSDEPVAEANTSANDDTSMQSEADAASPVPTTSATMSDPISQDLGMTPATVGTECDSDTDCGDGVVCLSADETFQEGAIAGGLCTFRCEQDEAACGASSICAVNDQGTPDEPSDDVGYCFELCAFTGPSPKCAGSRNRACIPLDSSGLGVCQPKCYSDGECAEGYCLQYGPWSCVDEPPTGDPDGSICETAEDCRGGFCAFLAASDATGVCITNCSLQPDTVACGRDVGDTTPAASVCFPPLGLLLNGIVTDYGDIGECLPTCDVERGCPHPGWGCLDMEDDEWTADAGYPGICVPNELLMEAAPELGAGGAPGTDEPVNPEPPNTTTDETEDVPPATTLDAGASDDSPTDMAGD